MNEIEFREILKRFKASLEEKSYEQLVRFRRFIAEFLTRDEDAKMVVALTKMDLEQSMKMIQVLMREEDLKKPSLKIEFNEIIKDLKK